MEDETNPCPQGEYRVPPTPAPPQLGTTSPTRWSKAHKHHIAQEVEQRASLMYFCDAQIRERFSQGGELLISEITIAQYAIALFNDLAPLWK
jgi:hypothetical protein